MQCLPRKDIFSQWFVFFLGSLFGNASFEVLVEINFRKRNKYQNSLTAFGGCPYPWSRWDKNQCLKFLAVSWSL